jgi:hypothetical protein
MGKKGKTPSKKSKPQIPTTGMKTRSQPDTPEDAPVTAATPQATGEDTAVGGETPADPPSPVVQQLAEAFDGVINQGREQLNLLASTIGTQSEDDILAAEEMAEFEDCKDDPQVAPIPDPSVEEMKAFGIQVAGGYDVTEITNAAPALEPEQEATNAAPDLALADDIQADDSSVGSTATDPDRPSMTARARSNSASSSSTSGKSVASVFDTVEFKDGSVAKPGPRRRNVGLNWMRRYNKAMNKLMPPYSLTTL